VQDDASPDRRQPDAASVGALVGAAVGASLGAAVGAAVGSHAAGTASIVDGVPWWVGSNGYMMVDGIQV
jgi:outer membrane lipoprotein SlyB